MITPSQVYRRTSYQKPRKILLGADAAVHSVAGMFHRRSGILKSLKQDVDIILAQADEWSTLSDHDLSARLFGFREQFRRGGEFAECHLLPALAGLREAAERKLGLRPFPVQLIGALALHRGMLAEMATGEGKTLTAGLAAVLSGWNPHPCHVITVNDYLVQRDAKWMQPLFKFARVRVGTVVGGMKSEERRKGHNQDVTYTTSKELLADFLRDRLRQGQLRFPAQILIRRMLQPRRVAEAGGAVLRGLHTVIVDEADSVLIDEAVTPLIISAPRENKALENVVTMANQIVRPLERDRDYHVDLKYREVTLTDEGRERISEECARLPGIWQGFDRREELIQQALVAREFFIRDKQYVVVEGKVVIVDEFTGRPMPQRSWRQGMHQAIEAKESVDISDPAETSARLSFQRFFRFFKKMSGMTGTGREAAREFWQIYRLSVISIPTNEPCIRKQLPDRVFATEDEKWDAVVSEIKKLHAEGRPVLVGTRSVITSQKIADMLKGEHIRIHLLNAVHHLEEAQVISDAGEVGSVTIATNMAGRGTDVKLGKGVAELGGLFVLATEKHESLRVDRQLFGRSGRQGDPGGAQMFVSVEDEILKKHLSPILSGAALNFAKGGFPGSKHATRAAFQRAQSNAQKLAFKQRKSVLSMACINIAREIALTGIDDPKEGILRTT
ncbi:prepilin peptidase [Verrucomicrobia bacterium]|nr:prepilin peptidase [Verrucomicrobiota bacterium]